MLFLRLGTRFLKYLFQFGFLWKGKETVVKLYLCLITDVSRHKGIWSTGSTAPRILVLNGQLYYSNLLREYFGKM